MKRVYTLVLVILMPTFHDTQAMKYGPIDDHIISSSSYYIYQGADPNDVRMAIPSWSKEVSFYTYDGNLIKTIRHHNSFLLVPTSLDKTAAKPQPCFYTVNGTQERSFICFYDKHGNQIENYSYDSKQHIITVSSPDIGTKDFAFDPLNPESIDLDFPLNLSKTKRSIDENVGLLD